MQSGSRRTDTIRGPLDLAQSLSPVAETVLRHIVEVVNEEVQTAEQSEVAKRLNAAAVGYISDPPQNAQAAAERHQELKDILCDAWPLFTEQRAPH